MSGLYVDLNQLLDPNTKLPLSFELKAKVHVLDILEAQGFVRFVESLGTLESMEGKRLSMQVACCLAESALKLVDETRLYHDQQLAIFRDAIDNQAPLLTAAKELFMYSDFANAYLDSLGPKYALYLAVSDVVADSAWIDLDEFNEDMIWSYAPDAADRVYEGLREVLSKIDPRYIEAQKIAEIALAGEQQWHVGTKTTFDLISSKTRELMEQLAGEITQGHDFHNKLEHICIQACQGVINRVGR